VSTYPIIDTWCNLFTPASMKKNYIDKLGLKEEARKALMHDTAVEVFKLN